VDYLARADLLGGGLELIKDRLEPVQAVVGNPSDDEPQSELGEVVLGFELTIDGYKDIEALLSQGEQGAVLARAPFGFRYRSDRVPGKGSFQASGDTLV